MGIDSRRRRRPLGRLGVGVGALAAAGAGALAYAAGVEVRSYRLRRATVPLLPPGSAPLRVLHLSDVHLTPRQQSKIDWLRNLAANEPDLVVNTGDNLAHPESVPVLLDAIGPLLDRPGVFVRGSNDYWAPTFKNPARYLLPDDGKRVHGQMLPWRDLTAGFTAAGWLDLNNARGSLTLGDGRRASFVGTDDPHIRRDRYEREDVGGRPDAADLQMAVTHAPYQRILDAFAADGWPLILAGHTHGGQLCVPGFGALVTNCDLDRSRAKGLSRHRASWLHVSAGLGTSPFAPVRFACPPEASLLTLVAADTPRADAGSG